MADPIRLYAEFQDDLGTVYKLNIHQAGFGASATEFNLGADGFTLRYSGNNEDRMQPIIGSEVTFTLTENQAAHTSFLTALATSEDADFTVSIYKDPDNTNTLFWTGVLLHEQVDLMDEAYPIQNTLTAVDGLGNLKNITYDNSGTFYTGRETIAAHLTNLLNKTRALHVFSSGDVFLKYANDFEPTTFASANALIELEVGHAAFYNLDDDGNAQGMDCFTVLKNFAITLNARVFLHEGCFYFVPVGAMIDSTTVDLYTVTKGGTISASATPTDTQLTVGTDMVKLRGGVTTFLPPLNKVQRVWRTDANLPVTGPDTQFLNATAQQTELGTAITDNDLLYDNGTEFRLRFRYTHAYDGDGTSTGQDVPARILLKMRVKVGSLYYNNAVTFGAGTMNVGYAGDTYTMDTMTFSAPAWSSSAGYFYFAVTPTPAYLNRNNGLFYNMTFTPQGFASIAQYNQPVLIDLDGITSAQTGVTINVSVEGYDHDGTLITDVTGTDAFGKLEDFALHVVSGGATNGDRVIYEALTTANNQETQTQDEVVVGSSDFDDYRNLYENNSSPAQPINSFKSFANSSATLPIHQLGVKEVIAGQNASTRVKRGSFYQAFVSPFHALLFDTRNFLPFETAFMARAVETEYEAFHITTDDTNVSTPTPEVIDDRPPIDDSEPVYDLRNTFTPSEGDIPPNIFQRFLQQPVTEVTNRAGTTYNITSTDAVLFNTWTGGNGTGIIYLPTTTGNEGRIIRFKSDDTIAANKKVVIRSDAVGETIDGATSYDFDRSYDGVSLLCYDGKWFVVQKKEKGGGGSKTTTPTLASISDFESTNTATITVSNYDSAAEYLVKLYNSSNSEVSHTITDNSDGTFTIASGLAVGTDYYVTVEAAGFGELKSDAATSNNFDSQAAATQMRYWRLQITDSTMTPVSNKRIALGEFRLYTQTGASGTPYPSNMTSATTPSPYVVTRGYQFQNYHAYFAFDGSGSSAGSMYWTLGNHAASDAWIQIDLGSSIDLGSGECRISTSGAWTDAEYAVLYGSNTGSFSGEERRMAFFQNIKTAGQSGGTFSTFTQAIT